MSERYRCPVDGDTPRDAVESYVERRVRDDQDALRQLVVMIMTTLDDDQFDEIALSFGFRINR
jgi:hypothetical protein